ncbi:alkaline phosphatase family protein [Microlunatus elymi]|uniref:Alkaline phosphatase family protein n=1 Tax=Microlunatus elymi TaxID=2596828 RepID=A0A516PWC4_9ACTN|nr:alkaline phosphatase family protein [Microlunatus elymi]
MNQPSSTTREEESQMTSTQQDQLAANEARPSDGPSTRHVLVIGIDGVRYDTLRRLPTPGIDAIAEAGFLAPVRVNEAGPTISGPSWATIFTGVLADRHLIFDNDFTGHRLQDFPDLIKLAQRERPGLPAFAGPVGPRWWTTSVAGRCSPTAASYPFRRPTVNRRRAWTRWTSRSPDGPRNSSPVTTAVKAACWSATSAHRTRSRMPTAPVRCTTSRLPGPTLGSCGCWQPSARGPRRSGR